MARLLWLYMVRLVAVHFGSYCLPSSNSSYFCGAFFPSLDLLNDLASLRILSNPISFLCSALVSAIELMQNAVFQVPVLAYHNWQYFASPFVGTRTNLHYQASTCLCRCLSAPHWVDWHPRERRRFDVCCSLLWQAVSLIEKMANIRDREANPISADSQLGFCEQKSIFLPPRYHNFVPSPCNQLPHLNTSFAKVQLNYPNLGFDGGCDTWDKRWLVDLV